MCVCEAGERAALVSLCPVSGACLAREEDCYWLWLGAHGRANELMQQKWRPLAFWRAQWEQRRRSSPSTRVNSLDLRVCAGVCACLSVVVSSSVRALEGEIVGMAFACRMAAVENSAVVLFYSLHRPARSRMLVNNDSPMPMATGQAILPRLHAPECETSSSSAFSPAPIPTPQSAHRTPLRRLHRKPWLELLLGGFRLPCSEH